MTRPARPLASIVHSTWLPAAVGVACLAGSVMLWHSLRSIEQRQLEVLSRGQAKIATDNLRRSMIDYGKIFAGIAQRYQAALRHKTDTQLQLIGLRATLWAEPSGTLGWIAPAHGTEDLRALDLAACGPCRDALARASGGEAALTGSLVLGGRPSFLLLTPVSGAAGLEGYLVGVFAADGVFPGVFRADTSTGWAIAVIEDGSELFRRGAPVEGRWLAESSLTVLGADWTIRVGPGADVAAPLRTPLPAVVLAAGSAIALLLAGSVGLARSARRRTRESEAVQAALRESENSYRLLFESHPQPMWVYDPATLRFLAVNNAAVHEYGYTRDEFLAMTLADIRPAEDVGPLWQSVLSTPDARRKGAGWRHRKKDGTLMQVEISSHPVTFAGNRARLVMALDISERRRLEEQLLHSQKLEAVGQLAGGVAHDFNNLLGVITGYGELLQKETDPADPRSRRIEQIRKAAERAGGLTRQLLAFSRKHILQPRVLDLGVLVNDIEPMVRRLIGEDVELVTLTAAGLGRIKADPGQLEQVLMNLVVNARDAMPRGGRLTVEVSNIELDEVYARSHPGVRSGPWVMLSVSDTGQGMAPEVLAHAFEPFFTTKEPGRGTGLGLATVDAIVKQSGGHVFVNSEEGRGTVFQVYLPRLAEAADEPDLRAGETELPRGSETILLVEDESALRSMVRECLEECGYTVVEALDPDDALALIARSETPVDLLATDVVMPGMSGRELAERAASSRPGLKVLYMSGYTSDAVVRHGVHDAEVAFVQKPFTSATLARRVREALDRPATVRGRPG